MLTAYDSQTARIFDDEGIKVLLVGDSAGMVVYGDDTTISVTLEQLIPLAVAVVRSTSSAMVIGDLPFGSYQESPEQALRAATRYMKEAEVQAVKLEGGESVAPQVERIVNAGIPVMGHVGLTPQYVHAIGGLQYVQGRGNAGERVVRDAKALEAAGAFAVVVEAVPAELAESITMQLAIPTVGIGAGPGTDAQVLVWQDMAGLTTGHVPKFVKQYADLQGALRDATRRYVQDVTTGAYPDEEHSYE
jgi:3-methyl-2-oxobutanoate hydroxymethyltransferase